MDLYFTRSFGAGQNAIGFNGVVVGTWLPEQNAIAPR